ncbi:uncharacterized protein LOC118769506 [Megalops cyprinoides]|uniref:uncharacterized protein LOC118769506 n=1 Tax=Megalops cyprinoides TaxID=118141 RepID=UPI0018649441|nr:uncharacterized protein LOC118769506 [Megalops cyprinoides]
MDEGVGGRKTPEQYSDITSNMNKLGKVICSELTDSQFLLETNDKVTSTNSATDLQSVLKDHKDASLTTDTVQGLPSPQVTVTPERYGRGTSKIDTISEVTSSEETDGASETEALSEVPPPGAAHGQMAGVQSHKETSEKMLSQESSCEAVLDDGERVIDQGEGMIDQGEGVISQGKGGIDHGEGMISQRERVTDHGQLEKHSNVACMFGELAHFEKVHVQTIEEEQDVDTPEVERGSEGLASGEPGRTSHKAGSEAEACNQKAENSTVKLRAGKGSRGERERSRLDSMVLLMMKLDQLDQDIENALSASSSVSSVPSLTRAHLSEQDFETCSAVTSPAPVTQTAPGAKPKTMGMPAVSEKERAGFGALRGTWRSATLVRIPRRLSSRGQTAPPDAPPPGVSDYPDGTLRCRA